MANTIIMTLSASQDRQPRVRIRKQIHFVKFTQELRRCVSESSVRNMKKAYFLKLKCVPDPADINSLPHAALGRPLPARSELDADIADCEYVRALHLAGGIVNRTKFNGR